MKYKLQEELKRKSVILLSARVHPGEAPSSWIMRGILHFLTGDSQVAADLRDKFIFKVKSHLLLVRSLFMKNSI